jgi:hypothetical protein
LNALFGTDACRCKISAADLKYLLKQFERSEGFKEAELQLKGIEWD